MSLFLNGCGAEDSELAKRHQATLDLDSKNYDAIIANLGDCTQFSGDDREKCLLDLGASYMAKGGFSLLSLGQEVLDLERKRTSGSEGEKQFSEDLTKLLIEKVDNEFVARGVDVVIQLLTEANSSLGSRVCTQSTYKDYGRYVSQGCISSNPLLLKSLLIEETDDASSQSTSSVSVSLKDVVNYKNTIQDMAPEISIDEVVEIINQKTPQNAKDKNGNKTTDSLDATSCVIDAYQSGIFQANDCTSRTSGIEVTELSTDVFNGSGKSALNNVFSLVTTISNGVNRADGNVFYRLAQMGSLSTRIITVSTKGFCKSDGVSSCLEEAVNGTTCLPCPIIQEGSTRTQTLEDSIGATLNNKDSFKALAATLESGDDETSDADKEKELREKICGNPIKTKCPGKNADGSVNIPTDVVLDYFQSTN